MGGVIPCLIRPEEAKLELVSRGLHTRAMSRQVITHALYQRRLQALTVARIVRKTVAPGVRRAVSTTVRIAASPSAAHVAR